MNLSGRRITNNNSLHELLANEYQIVLFGASFLLTSILAGIIVNQKYCAMSRLIKEIPIDAKKTNGGVDDCKSMTLFNEGLVWPRTDFVLTAVIQIIGNIAPVRTRIIWNRINAI